MLDTPSLCQIKKLLVTSGFNADSLQIKDCHHGGNNRTYLVDTATKKFVVKKYFREQNDKRNRLAAEFSFLQYAMNAASEYVPKAYSQDEEQGLGLYEFIDGSLLAANSITKHILTQAIHFFGLLNDKKMRIKANLPLASEAGFSLEDHFNSVDKRIQELKQVMNVSSYLGAKELIFDISKRWQRVLAYCLHETKKFKLYSQTRLENSLHCISPSDFGFHNALYEPKTARMRFIDFEYAGWDDPSRMVNDFFSQLAVPVPPIYYDWFVAEIMQSFENSDLLIARAYILKPVYQIKWCCIALNVFCPLHLARRRYANPHLNEEEVKTIQMLKAKTILTTMEIN